MNLLQMSFSGAVMILVIVVIRALAIHKLPKKAFLVLWGVAVVRLLIPYSLRSAFSVYSLLERLTPTAETIKDSSPVAPFIPMAPSYYMAPTPGTAITHTATVPIDLWVVVWVVGALVCAVFFAVAYLKCRREFKASLPVDNEYAKHWLSEHCIYRTIEIRQSGRISAPLTYGMFHPVILMPKTTDWDDGDTLAYVLAHEYVHIRRFDAVTKLVLTVALCIHWFNPAVWIMYVLANRDIELSCDEAVIREFGERTKSAYAMTLIRMEETRNGLTPLCNNFSKNAIEERIIAIMKIKKTSLAALIVAMALVVGVTTGFATSAKADEERSRKDADRVPDTTDAVAETTEFSFEGTTFHYRGHDYDVTTRSPSINSILSAVPVGDKIVIECHVGPHNGIYCIFDTVSKTFERDIAGHDLIWHSDDVTTAVYAFWSEVYTYDGSIVKNYNLDERTENGGMIYEMQFSDDHTKLYVKIVYDDGTELTDIIDLPLVGEVNISAVTEGIATSADFTQYKSFGLTWDNNEKVLYYNGERVRYFLDGVDLDGTGAMAIWLEYADAELKGDIDVHTVREQVQNADGSYDPMGPLTGLEKYSQAEFDARSFLPSSLEAVTYASEDIAWQTKETQEQPIIQTTYAMDGTSEAEPGTSFAERFEKYAFFGITYEEAKGTSGAGNVYYNGQLVSQFADLTPDGGAFTFSSAKQGGIKVKTVYDSHGKLTGVETVET